MLIVDADATVQAVRRSILASMFKNYQVIKKGLDIWK
jgi:hypothetical protein